MGERGGGRCSPCSPQPAQQPLFPDMVFEHPELGAGHPENKAAEGETDATQGAPQEPVITLDHVQKLLGVGQSGAQSRLSWGVPLGAQGEGGRDGSGGGQGQERRRRPPTGSGCGSGSRTTGRLQPGQSLKLLPAWLRAHEGQAVWSQRQRVGEEGFLQPPPHPRSRGVRAQGCGTAAWCPLVGLEDALSEAPGTGLGGKGAENLRQRNREGPSARPVAPPPSCPPQCSRGRPGQL